MNDRIFDEDFMEDFLAYDDTRFETCESCEALVEAGSSDHVRVPPDGSADLCFVCAADEWLFRCPHCGDIMRLFAVEDSPRPDMFLVDQALISGKIRCPLCEEWVGLDLFHVDMVGRLIRERRVQNLMDVEDLSVGQAERQAACEFELKKEDLS